MQRISTLFRGVEPALFIGMAESRSPNCAMERRHIKWVPLLLAGLFFAYQYFSSEKFVNPETGRESHVGMSTQRGGVTWAAKLSASPGAIGTCRFGAGTRKW